MSKWALSTVTALLLMASSSLYAQKVSYDWDKDIDFSPYRSYRWADVSGGKAANQLTHERIIGGINVQLQAKNLKLTAEENADLYVTYQVMTEKNGQIISFNPDGQWRPGLGLNGDASKPPAGAMSKGALIINVYDHKQKRLIWRGTVMGAFDSRQALNYSVDKGISKLFSYFPPPGAK